MYAFFLQICSNSIKSGLRMSGTALSPFPLIPFSFPPDIGNKSYPLTKFPTRKLKSLAKISCSRSDNSSHSTSQQQQLNLSVLRFTFGIPGLDESYLPRWIGYAFGSLLLLNHFGGSDFSAITPAQLRTEVLGLSLAAFSIVLPYLGKFLKGATPNNEKSIPEGAEPIFLMSQNIPDTLKEDLAWGTYVLLRNTNTISVLIFIQDALCVRGYWNTPKDIPKDQVHDWFEKEINKTGLFDLRETLYFPQAEELWEILPRGTRSFLIQPVLHTQDSSSDKTEMSDGFVLLASSSTYAYSSKDRAWIRAVANKFRVDATA
ncbi:protein COFACTOR ASSEMBLY OF COMPLEX C SUBUNIT B CCB2, chloroplastic-like isoform X2 [Coffea arabica]|uniref:Protein COFACTOR ASSEMBLY OF COMPLEX C SUBUNIT B CCB2, chloroplastic-like isoform X2 n=1 Tax=Coffea arabica TaxID=13443 RepID=A0A6P6UNS3_COFAR|nr:protein COFACTOR ASSEMBLY OF COMPLEX C SUBUNIT B CCB2, chloroplastic-like isoform X2 [Coffea arabica]